MYYRIRNLREDADLSQEKLARLLHINQATYSRYETGDLEIPVSSLIKLAEFYSTSVDYLVNLTDSMEPYPKT
ncbi:TPA: helix-turn-helix transcriptional regulator [Enterococcus faecalis]|uniref:Helix-turn-helix transcriptional regulator n=2 Tax=Enterococcus faecalis TaxID=1351 RepID=A0ABD7XSD2_ENTFL|nr:helix-turn-helix transcriptional regulator [Enterococcus faecalis]MBU5496193.1 helix-turn-helix domain-containing protein [Enterococcus sp. S171_ASV_20]MBU5517736.1 helix-turn-helix domain-containing protein [Enterococcus sp. S163_ASV_20]MBU5526465.1 helix-turn-helix domain-containing protein [Enterococcus sp. S159_ASV_20]MBU5554466.1 helix-turn-helix domain-containing protein [Enterococcus sp. S157_ASV_20]MBU5560347.1 helix-turn-helix domain-containing protein [Enterococcus sp. S115_ASV_20